MTTSFIEAVDKVFAQQTYPEYSGWTVTNDPANDGVIIRGEILGHTEVIHLHMPVQKVQLRSMIITAIEELTDLRWATVGPEFRMAQQHVQYFGSINASPWVENS